MPRITEMFAFIACDTSEDDEGITSWRSPEGILPMVGGDVDRVGSWMARAQHIADVTGKPVRIYKFTHREQTGEVTPRAYHQEGA